MLFEAVVLEKPTKEEAKNGKLETIILGPVPLIAKDDRSAGVKVVMTNAEKLKEYDENRIEVMIRPFAE